MSNSREKGKRGEREFAQFLRDHGVEARRGIQYAGGPESPDVVSNLPVHWEVKRTETFRHYAALEQAISDSGPDKIPIVAHRKNNQQWICLLRASDLVTLICALIKLKTPESSLKSCETAEEH